jgi:hypothetical protein
MGLPSHVSTSGWRGRTFRQPLETRSNTLHGDKWQKQQKRRWAGRTRPLGEGDIVTLGGKLLLGDATLNSPLTNQWQDSGLIATFDTAIHVDGSGDISASGSLDVKGGSVSGPGTISFPDRTVWSLRKGFIETGHMPFSKARKPSENPQTSTTIWFVF